MHFVCFILIFFFKQKTAYELRISDWSSDVCSSDLVADAGPHDTPYLHPFHGCRLVDLLRVPRFQEEVAASPAELTAHEAAIHDRNNDMPLDGADRKSTRLNSSH